MSTCSTVYKCPREGLVHLTVEVQEHEGTGTNVVMVEKLVGLRAYREFYSVKGAIALSNLLNNLKLPKER